MQLLDESYFASDDVVYIARDLVGKVLRLQSNENTSYALITETEAYRAPEDKASHAYNHRRTSRTEVFYRRGGYSYVYLCYGVHFLFNIVSGPIDVPHAVLIRSVIPIELLSNSLYAIDVAQAPLTSGPGKLTRFYGINKDHNAIDLCQPESLIQVFQSSSKHFDLNDIQQAARIGIQYAGEWASKPWRFYILPDSIRNFNGFHSLNLE